jgi:chromosome segregation ATPase
MGKSASAGTTPVSQTASPEELREQIEATRHELGDTVAGLVEKADVKTQARHKLEETKSRLREKNKQMFGKAQQASPDQARTLAAQGTRKAREKPLLVAAGGAFLAGLLLGRAIGRCR